MVYLRRTNGENVPTVSGVKQDNVETAVSC